MPDIEDNLLKTSDLEDRLLKNAAIIMFLSDIFSQPAPRDCANVELSEDGRYGLSLLLQDLGCEAKKLYSDVADVFLGRPEK